MASRNRDKMAASTFGHYPILPQCGVSLSDPDWVRRSIRPPARGNHEHIDWFRSATKLWIQHDGRVGQICTSNGAVHEWSVKHQVSYPVVVVAIGKVLFFRHHVGHGSRLQGRQLLLYECLDAFDDLSFGLTGPISVLL